MGKINGVEGLGDSSVEKVTTQLGGNMNDNLDDNDTTAFVGESYFAGENGMGNTLFGSEELNKLTLEAKEVFKSYTQNSNGIVPKVTALDNGSSQVAYSSIIMHTLLAGKTYVYLIVMDNTGVISKTPSEIINEGEQHRKNNSKMVPFTPERYIDKHYMAEVAKALNVELSTIINCRFTIVRGTSEDVDVKLVCNVGYQALKAKSMIVSGKTKDINIAVEMKRAKTTFNIVVTPVENDIKDALGAPVRADLVLTSNVTNKVREADGEVSPNVGNHTVPISETSIAYSLIPVKAQDHSGFNEVLRLVPRATITNLNLKYKTLGSALLAIANATECRKRETYLGVLASIRRPNSDIGSLNPLLIIDPVGDPKGTPVQFNNKKLAVNDRVKLYDAAILREVGDNAPLAIDVTMGSADYGITAEFLAATTDAKAAKGIIAAAVTLCNGNFPADYPADKIFIHKGVSSPAGKLYLNSGVVDIRNVDLGFIAKAAKDADNKLAYEYISAMVGKSDNYMVSIDVLKQLFGTGIICKIEATTRTLTFHSDFLNKLTHGLSLCNYGFNYTPPHKAKLDFNFGNIQDYFNGAMGGSTSISNLGNGFGDNSGLGGSYNSLSGLL